MEVRPPAWAYRTQARPLHAPFDAIGPRKSLGGTVATVMAPRFVPVGDNGVLVEFATEIDDRAHDAVLALDRAIADAPPDGVIETVPAFVSLLVVFDPISTDHAAVGDAVRALLVDAHAPDAHPTQHTVQCCYDRSFGPDLDAVADACGLSVDAVIEAHVLGRYRVYLYGFAPGYAYLGGVHESIRVPRKSAPVRGVAAGSVMIAGQQGLVTTIEMPTGWSVIGRSPTPILLDDPARPFRFDVGDEVVFERIDRATFDEMTSDEMTSDGT